MPSTYTFSQKTPRKNVGGYSFYGNQPVDGARVAIQGIGNGIQTSDASATVINSPQTLGTTAVTLTTPDSAIELTITNYGSTNDIYVSEVSSFASYDVIAPGEQRTYDVGNQSLTYVKGSAASASGSFYYNIV